MKTAVVALGGNAILPDGEKQTVAAQFKNARNAAKNIMLLAKKYRLVVTHGNGPQVGNILIRVEEALDKAYGLPLSVCVAESQGEIGYIIEQSLQNIMHGPVVSVLTQVLVDKNDPAFSHPTKPIGPFYTHEEAKILRKKGMHMVEDSGRGYRRVVASPQPRKVIEADTIKKLSKSGVTVIASGGGGIPVYRQNKKLHGVDAVIDKDLASACLARDIRADAFFILTGVSKVCLNYKKHNEKKLDKLTIRQAEQYMEHFPPGSMGPKIRAAINFIRGGGKEVIITSPERLNEALKGRDGTRILK